MFQTNVPQTNGRAFIAAQAASCTMACHSSGCHWPSVFGLFGILLVLGDVRARAVFAHAKSAVPAVLAVLVQRLAKVVLVPQPEYQPG